jgi:uncharacterized protein
LNKSLEQLVQISKFDSQISSFTPQINTQNEKLQQFEAIANRLKSDVAQRDEAIEEAISKRGKNNAHLEEQKSKLKDTAKKLDSISNQKEAKALQVEEEIAREQITFTNTEIDRLDNLIELKRSELIDLEKSLAEEEETVKLLGESVSKEIEILNVQRDEVSQKREDIISKVDTKVLSFYQKIKRWAGDTAVVPVKKQACYGCFMKISDKTHSAVLKAEEIVACPHCGRVIYKEIEELTAEEN